ncbi:MAG: enoyl-CoA hydratase/isomerase family protein [Halobacteriales archaeon]|nr:enoyl-CoA hydratase/isomerase family protein [Halobacteriales archaeon]
MTGAGGAFSAGGDIARMRERIETDMPVDDAVRSIEENTAAVVGEVHRFPLPTVARIVGPAVGAGAGLALACDLQLASEEASMGFVFRHVGLTADAGVSYLLPRLVGPNVAKELLLTGEILDAERALELGLLNHVYADDEFDQRVDELVGTIASGPDRWRSVTPSDWSTTPGARTSTRRCATRPPPRASRSGAPTTPRASRRSSRAGEPDFEGR